MSATEIILIVIGGAVFLLGYLMPARKKDLDEEVQLISEDEVRKLIASEEEHVKERISDIVEETVSYSIEKAERAMERLTNEKIMAVSEYSDTVLEEINKNHKEVVFLYDMLNDKHDNLMSTINEATVAADDIKQTVKDAEITANEAADRLDVVIQAIDEAEEAVKDAENAAIHVQDSAQKAMNTVIRAVENAKNDLERLHSAGTDRGTVVEEVRKPVRDENMQVIPELEERIVPAAGVKSFEEAWEDTVEQTADVPVGEAYTELAAGLPGTDGYERFSEEEHAEFEENTVRMTVNDISEDDLGEEVVDFKPISPRRVEIIHQPDGDYVAENPEEMSTSEAFASMGIFAPKTETEEITVKRPRTRRNSRRDLVQENASAVDIHFAQGKNSGRNSNERILELHKAGKSNMAIAKELGLGLGEVKLVIDLFEGM